MVPVNVVPRQAVILTVGGVGYPLGEMTGHRPGAHRTENKEDGSGESKPGDWSCKQICLLCHKVIALYPMEGRVSIPHSGGAP